MEGPAARSALLAHQRGDHPETQDNARRRAAPEDHNFKNTKKQRDRERKEKQRRSEGVAPREEYLAECRESRQHNRHLATELKAQGMSLREIGCELGISHMLVKRLLESGNSEQ